LTENKDGSGTNYTSRVKKGVSKMPSLFHTSPRHLAEPCWAEKALIRCGLVLEKFLPVDRIFQEIFKAPVSSKTLSASRQISCFLIRISIVEFFILKELSGSKLGQSKVCFVMRASRSFNANAAVHQDPILLSNICIIAPSRNFDKLRSKIVQYVVYYGEKSRNEMQMRSNPIFRLRPHIFPWRGTCLTKPIL
jgi:hypothetical protein